MSKIKLFLRESWLLIVASVVFGSLLAFTNAAWAPRIAQNEVKKFNSLAGGLLKGVSRFEPLPEPITFESAEGKPISVKVSRGLTESGQTAGWAFVIVGSGFADKIRLVVAVDADFTTLYGFGVLSSNETPGFGDRINNTGPGTYQSQFQGAPVGKLDLVKTGDRTKIDDQIVAMTGATVTSQAVVDTFNKYLVPIKDAMIKQGLIH